MFEFASRRKARHLIEPPLRQHYPEQALFYDGLANGSGQGLGTLLLLASAELLLSKIDYRLAGAACSAVAVRTADGVVLHKNFDYPEPVRPYYFIRTTRPNRGFASIEMTVAPLAGTIDGLNERGLAVTYNYAFCLDLAPEAVPVSITLNELLRTCATVDDGLDFLSKHPHAGGAILMLADARGTMASVELSNTQMSVRHPAAGRATLTHSNHYRSPEMQRVEIPHSAVYSHLNPHTIRGLRILDSSEHRGARLEEIFGGAGPFDADSVWRRMSDHAGGSGGDNTICRHGLYFQTTAAIQLFPAQRRLRAAWGKPCERPPETVTLEP
jgi:hypothetical protein